MKFSLFYELQLDSPTRAKEAALFPAVIEQIKLADKLGYHAVWVVEHHGLYEYSHSSAPEVLLGFAAAHTEKIRLGHGVTLLSHRYNHPIRVSERVATLDILSRGRVNFGTGKSASLVEQLAFENDLGTLHEQWEEALRMIVAMWQSDVFEYKGRFFDVPPIQIVPRPLQAPHPPLYAACTRPESAASVGRLGLGALNFALGSDTELADKIARYRAATRDARASGGAIGASVNDHFACTPLALVLPDDTRACRHGMRGARFFTEALNQYYFSGKRPVGPLAVARGELDAASLERAMRRRNTPEDTYNVCCGDPAFAREYVARFQALGVDELILVMQMGTVPSEVVLESVRTFGEQVLPYFANAS
jgi:alkanesulfonate monooxygenase SsuD/methylene tetrahydromethanopterin reductase-like flavin-dependent oxidoreductase (luciferase family)